MPTTGVRQGERTTQSESLFRDVNERLRSLNRTVAPLTEFGHWACECVDGDCFKQLSMTIDEYDRVRQHATWFAVSPGHVAPHVERVVEENRRYWVVEKADTAGDLADPPD